MEYVINEIELTNKTNSRKRLVIEFANPSYAILAEFLMSDAPLMSWRIIQDIGNVISGKQESFENSGNRTHIHVTKEETNITDLFSGMFDEEVIYKPVTIETKKLLQIISEWFAANEQLIDS